MIMFSWLENQKLTTKQNREKRTFAVLKKVGLSRLMLLIVSTIINDEAIDSSPPSKKQKLSTESEQGTFFEHIIVNNEYNIPICFLFTLIRTRDVQSFKLTFNFIITSRFKPVFDHK